MARPLPLTDSRRNGTNGFHGEHPEPLHLHSSSEEEIRETTDRPRAAVSEVELVRAENTQLRGLCQELEQALQEAAQQLRPDLEKQVREFDAVLEEKNEVIARLHKQVQELQAALESAKAEAAPAAVPSGTEQQGKLPSEAELLALSEQLERERRQLQEDEQTLMDQMREMEVSMARERAELARQRTDMQRLQNEIRHELERLERDGGIQSKIENLRNQLDITGRPGGAPPASGSKSTSTTQASPARKEGLMGRLFKRGSD
jgi:chromosome segregation ATPase